MKSRPRENMARKHLVTAGILEAVGLASAYLVGSGYIYTMTSGSTVGMYLTILLIMVAASTMLAGVVSLVAGVRARRPAVEAIDTIDLQPAEERKAA
jgi:outer membrane scaffolding protein for murein synthesis (MipA/OmpV family)